MVVSSGGVGPIWFALCGLGVGSAELPGFWGAVLSPTIFEELFRFGSGSKTGIRSGRWWRARKRLLDVGCLFTVLPCRLAALLLWPICPRM
jgi:hypothetical protein